MRGCEWKRQLKNHQSVETKLGRILNWDNESSLLKAIAEGKVFGFLLCDVSTSKEQIEEYKSAGFLFPMVIQRMELSKEHLSPYMKKRYETENKSPDMTVVQTYNGRDQFVMTPMVQLWLKRGMKVSNIKLFVQYQPGAALTPFVQKVYILMYLSTHLCRHLCTHLCTHPCTHLCTQLCTHLCMWYHLGYHCEYHMLITYII